MIQLTETKLFEIVDLLVAARDAATEDGREYITTAIEQISESLPPADDELTF
jgi:hypothetical protein